MDNDAFKFQYSGLQWLKDMEMINHPQLINQVKMNILLVSKRINEVELLIDKDRKAMLVYLELSWMGRKFYEKEIFQETEFMLSQMLPAFRFRVVGSAELFNSIVEKVKQNLTGGKSEKPKVNNEYPIVGTTVLDKHISKAVVTTAIKQEVKSGSETDLKKQS